MKKSAKELLDELENEEKEWLKHLESSSQASTAAFTSAEVKEWGKMDMLGKVKVVKVREKEVKLKDQKPLIKENEKVAISETILKVKEEKPGPLYYKPKFELTEPKVKGCVFGKPKVIDKVKDEREILYPNINFTHGRNKGTAIMKEPPK